MTAYYLVASQSEEAQRFRENALIFIDPVINPDGRDRHTQWANSHKSIALSADPLDREHNEGWPNGRTSYYWFDLNRDWMPLTHPVSRQRIAHYRQWRPHVLTDAHEMGARSTYFFQPGIPQRTNPLTPRKNIELTAEIAKYHVKAFDRVPR